MQKIIVWLLLKEIWLLLKKVEFLGAQNAFVEARNAQMRYYVIRNFTPIIFFSILRIFYIKMDTSEGGGGAVQVVRL